MRRSHRAGRDNNVGQCSFSCCREFFPPILVLIRVACEKKGYATLPGLIQVSSLPLIGCPSPRGHLNHTLNTLEATFDGPTIKHYYMPSGSPSFRRFPVMGRICVRYRLGHQPIFSPHDSSRFRFVQILRQPHNRFDGCCRRAVVKSCSLRHSKSNVRSRCVCDITQ